MIFNDYFILGLSSIIVARLHGICYERLSNTKFKANFKNIVVFFIFGCLFIANNYLIDGVMNRVIISVTLLTIMFKLIFNDNMKATLAKSLICYIVLVLIEMLLSIILVNLKYVSITDFNSSILVKCVVSFIELYLTILFIKNEKCNKQLNKVVEATGKEIIVNVFLIASAITMIILISKYEKSFNTTTYFTNLILILIFTGLMFISVRNNIKAKKESEKIETLLKFMSKYEKIIDEERINRHEMLNNLLMLKSFKNKNSKKYDDTINEIIKLYEKNGKETIKNVSTLPSGLKGILYYKVEDMKNNEIDVNINISKKIKSLLDIINTKEYVSLCKIFGIVLDNACDAAKESKEKSVFIEVFEIENKIYINVENSFKNKVDVNKLKEQYYSTKGKGRGLGLFLANKLIKESESIDMVQRVEEDRFISEITVML